MAAAWTVIDGLSADDQLEVSELLHAIECRIGDEALTETQCERLSAGVPVRHALRRDATGRLTGYGVIADGALVEAEPAFGTYDEGFSTLLEGSDRPVALLLRDVDVRTESALAASGWRQARVLHRLRRALPAPDPPPSDVVARHFVPGQDDEAWVAQNNAAFAGHPSQADMTVERLRSRYGAAWFDPSDFLLFYDATGLVASCWTKLHQTSEGVVGEIYVVSVDPSARGRGLGRLAVLEGLRSLARKGAPVAELFVEASNTVAYALYESLGFTYASRVVEFRLGEPGS